MLPVASSLRDRESSRVGRAGRTRRRVIESYAAAPSHMSGRWRHGDTPQGHMSDPRCWTATSKLSACGRGGKASPRGHGPRVARAEGKK